MATSHAITRLPARRAHFRSCLYLPRVRLSISSCYGEASETATLKPHMSKRHLSITSQRHSSSPLFNLGGLATSRESQYFSKEHRLPRSEYSSSQQLIRSSEVDPYAPAPGASKEAIAKALAIDSATNRLTSNDKTAKKALGSNRPTVLSSEQPARILSDLSIVEASLARLEKLVHTLSNGNKLPLKDKEELTDRLWNVRDALFNADLKQMKNRNEIDQKREQELERLITGYEREASDLRDKLLDAQYQLTQGRHLREFLDRQSNWRNVALYLSLAALALSPIVIILYFNEKLSDKLDAFEDRVLVHLALQNVGPDVIGVGINEAKPRAGYDKALKEDLVRGDISSEGSTPTSTSKSTIARFFWV